VLPLIEDFIQWVDAGVGQVRLTTAGVDWLEGVEAGKARHAD
jgi:hypothetical protein